MRQQIRVPVLPPSLPIDAKLMISGMSGFKFHRKHSLFLSHKPPKQSSWQQEWEAQALVQDESAIATSWDPRCVCLSFYKCFFLKVPLHFNAGKQSFYLQSTTGYMALFFFMFFIAVRFL